MISSSLCSHAASKLSIGREGRVQQTGGFLIKEWRVKRALVSAHWNITKLGTVSHRLKQ